MTGLPVTHLDDVFWNDTLEPLAADEWRTRQRDLTAPSEWILDGDLGPYDELSVRLERSDTIVLLDAGVVRCTWRVLQRGRERRDFWRWMLGWRRRDRPRILDAIDRLAPDATVVRLRSASAVERWVTSLHGGEI